VFTVSDNAKETCPIFPGDANRFHQKFDDPAAVEGSGETRLVSFRRVSDEMREYFSPLCPLGVILKTWE
jgi:arsenate reductase (thioredoxin)